MRAAELPDVGNHRRAMILYTSGTTSRPKGVVSTHANISAQIVSLVEAWEWCADDRILLCLPLHHVHGIINVVSCALWSGATCEMLPRFDASVVWERIAGGGMTLFMAVPTIYVRLIAAWDTNIDILKTGGYKVSALEIEEVLRQHPACAECAVVGVPDEEWGERVAVALVLKDGDALDPPSLRAWARTFLAPHKLPSRLLVLDTLPRNAMGKVTKPAVTAMFQAARDSGPVA